MSDTNEKIILSVVFDQSEALKRVSVLNGEIEKLKSTNDSLAKAGQKSSIAFAENAALIKNLSVEQAGLNKNIQASMLAFSSAKGSMDQMKAEVALYTKQLSAMTDKERDTTDTGKLLTKTLLEKTEALKALESGVGNNTRNVGNYGSALQDLKKKLKELKGEMLGLDAGSEEYKKAAQAAGDLKEKLKDVTEGVKGQEGGSNFEKIGNQLSLLKGDLSQLDFKGAAEKLKVLNDVAKTTTFAEMSEGIKPLVAGLGTLAKTILTNPIFLLAAVVIAVGLALKEFSDITNERAVTATNNLSEALKRQAEYYNDIINITKRISDETVKVLEAKAGTEIALMEKNNAEQIKKLRQQGVSEETINLAIAENNIKILKAQAATEEKIQKERKSALNVDHKLRLQNQIDLGNDIAELEKSQTDSKDEAQIKALGEQIRNLENQKKENKVIIENYNNEAMILDETYKTFVIKNQTSILDAQTQIIGIKKGKDQAQKELEISNAQTILEVERTIAEQKLDVLRKKFDKQKVLTDKELNDVVNKMTAEAEAEMSLAFTKSEIREASAKQIEATYQKEVVALANRNATQEEFTALEKKRTRELIELNRERVDSAIQLGQTLGKIIANSIDETGLNLDKLGKGIVLMALDTLEKIAIIAIGENAVRNIGQSGWYGLIIAAAESALITAAVEVAKAGLSKAAGGGDFMTNGPTMLMVGDNPGGVERVSVTPISGIGHTQINPASGMVQMGGGGSVTSYGGYAERNAAKDGLIDYVKLGEEMRKQQIFVQWSEMKKIDNRMNKVAKVSELT